MWSTTIAITVNIAGIINSVAALILSLASLRRVRNLERRMRRPGRTSDGAAAPARTASSSSAKDGPE